LLKYVKEDGKTVEEECKTCGVDSDRWGSL